MRGRKNKAGRERRGMEGEKIVKGETLHDETEREREK